MLKRVYVHLIVSIHVKYVTISGSGGA